MRLVLATLALLLPTFGLAQDQGGFNAHGFVPAPQDGDIRDGLILYRPGAMNSGEWFAGGLLEYANRPLVFVTESSDGETVRTPALNHLAALHLTGGVAVHERLRFGAVVPFYFTSSSFDGPQGANLGDIRLDALFLASSPAEDGIGLGVSTWIDLPTGSVDRFLGRGGVGGGFAGIGTYELEDWTFTGNLGLQLNPAVDIDGFKSNNAMLVGGGTRYSFSERSSLGLEALLRAGLTGAERPWTGSPAEAILTFRHRDPNGANLIVGLSAPLSAGVGAAAWRAFVGGGFGKIGPSTPRDRDGDGIPDKLDACPDEPETFNNYIDDDGCPDELSVLEVVARFKGEPVEGVELSLTGPMREVTATTGPEPVSLEVIPETLWLVEGKKGTCLAGTVKKLVSIERATAELDLQLVANATVRFNVGDDRGNPIEGVTLSWITDEPECLPDPPAFNERGVARADIGAGAGTHKATISAPGFRAVDMPIMVSEGDDITLDIKLQPTKLRVETKQIVILDKVKFETAKAVIRPDSYELLNEIAEVIIRNPQAGRVQVEGHTDSQGRAAYNMDLSKRRAEAVREYLIDKGVDPERLIAKGFGLERPVDTNKTPAGRARNRRVEFVLIDQLDPSEIEEH